MEAALVDEVLACLPTNRTLFRYCKDQYATYLLQRVLNKNGPLSVQQLKQSSYKQLLEKPFVREILQTTGKQKVEAWHLENAMVTDMHHYVLTLGKWGNRYGGVQTSRPGHNLVLQLNLPESLDAEFQRITGNAMNEFTSHNHPQSKKRTATLAWARLDINFESDEVLIEEIQSDLIRLLEQMKVRAQTDKHNGSSHFNWRGNTIPCQPMLNYCEKVASAQKKIWAEAMLSACLWFIHSELGISKVFYNRFETGNQMKNIDWCLPPRSLYTDLPEKFCFDLTGAAPDFIREDRKVRKKLHKIQNPKWYLLTI